MSAALLPPKRVSSWQWVTSPVARVTGDAQWWMLLPLLLPQFMGIAMALPVLPQMKLRYFGDATRAARAQGVMSSTRAALTFTVSSEFGRLSDAVGRKPLIVLSVVCTLTPLLFLQLTGDLSVYLALFALAGAMGGQTTPAASAYVADCCPADLQARSYSMLGAAIGASIMFGPTVGVWLESLWGQGRLLQAVVGAELLAVLVAFLLPESLGETKWRERPASKGFCGALRPLSSLPDEHAPALRRLVALRVVLGVATVGLETVLLFSMAQLAGFTDADFGVQMSLAGMASVVGQAVVLPLLMRGGCTEQHLLLLALGMTALQCCGFLTLLGWWPRKPLVFAMTLFGVGASFWTPACTALVTKMLQKDRGLVLGIFGAMDGLTAVVSPPLFSLLFAAGPLWPLACAALLSIMGLVLALATFSEAKEKEETTLAPTKEEQVAETQPPEAADRAVGA